MAHKSEQQKTSILHNGGWPSDLEKGHAVTLVHEDLPGWRIQLVMNAAGLVESLCLETFTTRGLPGYLPPGHPWAGDVLPVETTSPLPPGGVTSRLLRRLPLGELVAAVRKDLLSVAQYLSRQDGPDYAEVADNAERFARRPGRRGRKDRDYAEIAAAYVEILATNDRKPVETLASRTFLSPSQLRNVLYEARRRDLLTKSPPGRPGGQLTEKCHRILEEN